MSEAAPPVSVPRITTRRLLLREPRKSDFPTYFEHLDDLIVATPIPDRRAAWRMFASAAGMWMLNGAGWWLVEHRETAEMTGMVGAFFRESFPDMEVGWSMIRRFRRQGLATEAAAAAAAFAFERYGVERIVAHIDADNAGSIRVAEGIGMRFETDVDFYDHPTRRYVIERRTQ
ncbi:MAG: GNAT family N-acetyltransferase [Labilithrix sp.]|nr:GNAT family N-acetyltransferase [Labilithrix sp.]